MNIKNAPPKIYLNVGEDIDENTDFNSLSTEHITWCEDKVDNDDIEYVLAPILEVPESDIMAMAKKAKNKRESNAMVGDDYIMGFMEGFKKAATLPPTAPEKS